MHLIVLLPLILTPSPLQPFPLSRTIAQWAGALLLAYSLLQAAYDAVFVPEALAVGGPQGFHLTSVLDAVPLQLDPVLVSLLLKLLKVGVLLQKTQQMGHHSHQGRLCHLSGPEAHKV